MAAHPHAPDVSFDGGDLDCGNGLLLLIRRHIDPLPPGGLLEIVSTEESVAEDLPSWARLTGNELVSVIEDGGRRSFLVCKGALSARRTAASAPAGAVRGFAPVPVTIPTALPQPAPAPTIPPLAVTAIGSWPRPRWMLRAIHEHLEGRMSEEEFQETADDAVRLAVEAQVEAGVSLVTDGEQRRDSYASFVGGILDNAQLIPLSDLSAMVDDPETFRRELQALDVPAQDVRHPVPLGPLGRSRPLAGHELAFARTLTDLPVKVALPGPYLLTRTMWLDCLRDNSYDSRERIAADVVRVLREELHHLLAAGAALVQFDEPVLTEVVFSRPSATRSFMCGALSEKGETKDELAFAARLLNAVVEGLPRARTALHVCRGNWTRDESALLTGDYEPLVPYFAGIGVGTLFLEFSTPRAGELRVLERLDRGLRIGLGVVNPRSERIESADEIVGRAREAIAFVGADRLLLNPDCGFATFADNPLASARIAAAKLRAIRAAAEILARG